MTGDEKKPSEPVKSLEDPSSLPMDEFGRTSKTVRPETHYRRQIPPAYKKQNTSPPGSRSAYTKVRRPIKK